MEQQIRERYHDGILNAVMGRYGIQPDKIQSLKAFESFIYEYERESEAYILRISHSLRRSETLIQGEVDWINFLAKGGIPVARAIHSNSGQLVEAIEDGLGGEFLATAFVKAQGQSPWEAGWTTGLYETYGDVMGCMHAQAETYQPAQMAWKRPEWDDASMDFVAAYLPASEDEIRKKYKKLRDHLYTLPKDNTIYGLIHQDAHGSNFFVDEAGSITFFDFDECAYSWYVNDIAIALFYRVIDEADAPGITQDFLTYFFTGYQKAFRLESKWLKEIPVFLKIREIELYAVIHRDFDLSNIDDPWCEQFMRDRKYKLEHDLPTIDFDFDTLI